MKRSPVRTKILAFIFVATISSSAQEFRSAAEFRLSFEIQEKQKRLDRAIELRDRFETEIHAIELIQRAEKNSQVVVARIFDRPEYAASHFLEGSSEVRQLLLDEKQKRSDEIRLLVDDLGKLYERRYEVSQIPDGESIEAALMTEKERDTLEQLHWMTNQNKMLTARVRELEKELKGKEEASE